MNDRIGLGGMRIVGLLVALAVVAMLWRTGLPFQGSSTPTTGLFAEASPSSGDAAQANVRGAVPAIEAFFAEHGTYDGLGDPVNGLAASDPASASVVVVVSASGGSYCIQSTSGTETFSKHGPAGGVLPGPC